MIRLFRMARHVAPIWWQSLLGIVLMAPAVAYGFQTTDARQGTSKPVTPVQIDNAESTAKPDDTQTPEANPARPTITNPAHIPPVGYLQFEQGFVQANQSPASLSRQFSLNQVTRLSLHPRLMIQSLAQPYAHSHFTASTDGPASSENDAGDLLLGVQGVVLKEEGKSPSVALGYLHRVRGGTAPDIDIGSYAKSAVLLISGDLGGFHYDSNYSVSEQTDGSVRRAQYGQTLSVTHDVFPEALHDKLEATGEIWHFSQPLVTTTHDGATLRDANAVGTLWTLGYAMLPNLVFDGGFDRGLTSTSTEWQTFAGFTYLLPHRLWPHEAERRSKGRHKHIHRR